MTTASANSPPHASRPLRLALVSSGLGYTARGVEVWMTEVATHLPSEIQAELWSGGPPPPLEGRPARGLHGLNRDRFWLRRLSWHRRYLIEQLSVLPQVVLGLRRRRLDLVYCGDPVLSWHLKRFRRWHRAAVVFMNGMRLSANWAKDFDGVQLLAPPYLDAARRELPGRDLSNFFVVPHFVDVRRFRPPTNAERPAARSQHGLHDDEFVVLNLGPVGTVSGKRLEFLAAEIARAGERFALVSAGGDEDGADQVRSQIRQILGARARLLGPVPRSHVPGLFHAADAFSLASLAEPFSIAILEALASGVPVVHHDDPVTQWVAGDGGIAVSMTEPGAAAQAFRALQADKSLRLELGARARHLAESRYTPTQVCRDLTLAFERIIRQKATS